MKIYEFVTKLDSDDKKIDFDLTDDLIFFMRSDPEFYRTKYYPYVNKFVSKCKNKETPGAVFFKSLVKDGYKTYKEKFQVEALEEKLSIDMLKEICTKIHKEELDDYKKEQSRNKD